MKKIISLLLLATLALSLCACKVSINKGGEAAATTLATSATVEQFPKDAEGNPLQPSDAKISPERAQEIAREALGITKEQMLSPFVHIGTYGENNESCYSVQFATLDYDYEFVISAVTGEIYYRSDKLEENQASTQESSQETTQATEGTAND